MRLSLVAGALLSLLLAFTAAPASAQATKATWPLAKDGLVFGLVSGNAIKDPVVAFKSDGSPRFETPIEVRGFDSEQPTARYDRNYALVPSGGSFFIPYGLQFASSAIKKSGAFTLEVWITPANLEKADGTILSLQSEGATNLAVSQNKSALQMQLQTSAAAGAPLLLCNLTSADAFHLIVTFEKGELRTYINGKPAGSPLAVAGDVSNWDSATMCIGDDLQPGHPWPGTIEGIALFGRALTAEQANADAAAYMQKTSKRQPTQTWVVHGKLLAKTPAPDPAKILPYVQAMSMFEYEVQKVVSGKLDAKTIRVQTWVVMESKVMPVAERKTGDTYELVLEEADGHPWLVSQWLEDTLDIQPDVPVFYDVTPGVR